MATTITQGMTGKKCVFRSKSTADTRTWSGTIEGIDVSAAVAGAVGLDYVAYNAAVVQADSTVNKDPTALLYFLIRVENPDGTSSLTAFCQDWILDGSFALINPSVIYTVQVYGTDTGKEQDIITTLRLSGYPANMVSISQ